ncbi:hypothetical protein [Amycolatopsis sp. 195334CR]|uniref:hypothetical protein n=1 Tax=Amycolatopsis sp. 195334CR TaxID=2814588 RepID=UPI001A9006B5|nr:hypothetical protein [Amycolatopsis sp. 195334CR]MBN6037477.1 hypothetical protein [Amycolatopsis sp. 195334CR]
MITFKLKDDSGEVEEVTATTRDILNWERTSKNKSFGGLVDNQEIGDFYKIAFFAAKRTVGFVGTQQDFEQRYDLEFEVDDEVDPTNAAP